MKHWRKKVCIFILMLSGMSTALATSVLYVSLKDMSRQAEVIFHGKVLANEARLDAASHQVATLTTFKVIESIKGKPGDTYTIKQVGGHMPGSSMVYRVYGVPQFTVGEEYVLFLPKKSRLGFSSPVGLGQGSIAVFRENGINKVRYSERMAVQREVKPTPVKAAIKGKPTAGEDTGVHHVQPNAATPAQQKPVPATYPRLTDFVKKVRQLSGDK